MKRGQLKRLAEQLERLRSEQRQADAIEAQLAQLPPELRSMHGPIAALLSVMGPPQFRAGAQRVLTQRTFSTINAHMRRKLLRVVK